MTTIHQRAARPSGSELTKRYASALMNTFGSPQRVLVKGEGATVWDADGNSYVDLLAGIAVNALGHGHPALVAAVTEQMKTLGHISNFFASVPQITLAEKLLELIGAPGAVFFVNSGTEANEAALKATRLTGRTTVVAAHGSFHGRTMGALSLTSKEAYRTPFEPLIGDVRWVDFDDVEALERVVDDTVAAVVLEPIQGERGVIVPSADYLAQARRITSAHGALLWLDEIQTGMGRTGQWFAHDPDVQPDLITVAKGLGGGFPIGALIARGAAAELFGPGNHGTTFGGNPMAAAAGLAVIDTIESDGLLERVKELGSLIRAELADVAQISAIDGQGLLLGLQLTHENAAAVVEAGLDAGLIMNAPTPSRIRIAPPYILSDEQARSAMATLRSVLTEVGENS